ncbi:unnamed protein product [Parnassius apollo]|uniref:(apollo) hypothetical protein n=1 Tax=Parnassius apollo TaxID=110799 RepID=A0A8S3Y114_PARAO|nr:unnamed protein product [Parnassius apollo]
MFLRAVPARTAAPPAADASTCEVTLTLSCGAPRGAWRACCVIAARRARPAPRTAAPLAAVAAISQVTLTLSCGSPRGAWLPAEWLPPTAPACVASTDAPSSTTVATRQIGALQSEL